MHKPKKDILFVINTLKEKICKYVNILYWREMDKKKYKEKEKKKDHLANNSYINAANLFPKDKNNLPKKSPRKN